MVKGLSIKFRSYHETIPQLLKVIKLDEELKRHERIVLKPSLTLETSESTPLGLVESTLAFCVAHKHPSAEIFIAEGADGADTMSLFDAQGYRKLAERHGVSLIDLNNADCESVGNNQFVGFETIMYPSILKDSFVISLPVLRKDEQKELDGALSNMLGAFPARYYQGFFSKRKNKLSDFPLKYQVHDIVMCKMPELALIDASQQGVILAGKPLDMDKQAARLLGLDEGSVGYLRMIEETLASQIVKEQSVEAER